MNSAVILGRALGAASTVPAAVFVFAVALFDRYATLNTLTADFVAASVVSACHAGLLGLPVVFALRRKGRLNFRSMALSGSLVGAMPTLVLVLIQWATPSAPDFACQSDPMCQAALLSKQIWPGALIAVVAAGALGCLGALSFYAALGKTWEPHPA